MEVLGSPPALSASLAEGLPAQPSWELEAVHLGFTEAITRGLSQMHTFIDPWPVANSLAFWCGQRLREIFSHEASSFGVARCGRDYQSPQLLLLLLMAPHTQDFAGNMADLSPSPLHAARSRLLRVSTLPPAPKMGPQDLGSPGNSCLDNLGSSDGTLSPLSSTKGCDRLLHFLFPNQTMEAILRGHSSRGDPPYKCWKTECTGPLTPTAIINTDARLPQASPHRISPHNRSSH